MNFVVRSHPYASNGAFILATDAQQVARHVFTGAAGYYDLGVGYFDENDGVASMEVYVNNIRIDGWRWSQQLGSDFISRDNAVERAIDDVALRPGDVIELRGVRDALEPVRTDYIDFAFDRGFGSARPPAAHRIEAENFDFLDRFERVNNPIASGGAFIAATGGEQVARHVFDGASGIYDLRLGYYDENDGVASMEVFVNGVRRDAWDWNQQLGSDFISAGNLTERVISDVALRAGDVIELRGDRDLMEPVRTDYLDFLLVG